MSNIIILILILLIYFYFIKDNTTNKNKEGLNDNLDKNLNINSKKRVVFNEEDFYSKTLGLSSGDIVYNDNIYGILIEYDPKHDVFLNKDPKYNNNVNYGYNKNFDNCFRSYRINPKNKILLFFGTESKKLYLFPVSKNFLYGKKIKKRNFTLDENELQKLLISINKFYETNHITKGEMFVQELLMDANIIPYYIDQTYNKLMYNDNSFNTIKRDDEFNYLIGYMNSYIYV
jgi:hypothetical protein